MTTTSWRYKEVEIQREYVGLLFNLEREQPRRTYNGLYVKEPRAVKLWFARTSFVYKAAKLVNKHVTDIHIHILIEGFTNSMQFVWCLLTFQRHTYSYIKILS
jgi:hypothetical protein